MLRFSLFLLLIIITQFGPVYSRVELLHPDQRQRDALHDTVKSLLKIDQEWDSDGSIWRPTSKSAKAASKYMRRLFEKYRKHQADESDSEKGTRTTVRAITPRIGRFEDREALIFDLHSIGPNETVMGAEMHYYVGHSTKPVHCYSLRPSNTPGAKLIRHTDVELPLVDMDGATSDEWPKWLVFRAIQLFNTTQSISGNNSLSVLHHANNPPQSIAIIFAKTVGDRRVRVSPMQKTMRFHAPFLSVSTRDWMGFTISQSSPEEEQDDQEEEEREGNMRKKRNVDVKYYQYYHPYETPFTTSPNDVDPQWQPDDTTPSEIIQRGPSVLRRNTNMSGRRGKNRNRWGSMGRKHREKYLGDSYDSEMLSPIEYKGGKNKKKKYGKILSPREDDDNPTTVVLLDENKGQTGTCQRHDLVVDFGDIGWGEYVIAPTSFEAHYCDGSCPFPVPSTVNATNHAIVLDIIQKIRLHPRVPKPCCAPEKMDSLSLLYYDSDGNVVLTTYPKMSVLSCACL